jgi:scyllo-inositol 2-dehydrogenase (NADP+)
MAGRTFHAPVIQATPGLHLTKILQRHGEPSRDVPIVPTIDALLADDEIRLVVIATPNSSHFELARRCLLSGRHVVVDKPFTTTSREADELIEIATAQKLILSVHQNRRWDGDFLTVQQLIQSGELGRVVLFESHYDRYRPAQRPEAWREQPGPGSGMLFDLGSHLADQALVLFGEPTAITADVRIEREGGAVDDAFDIVMHYPNLRAVLRSTMLACEPGPRFCINGTTGAYTKYGLDPQEAALKSSRAPEGDDWGTEEESQWGLLTLPNSSLTVPTLPGDYRKFYANVRDAIIEKTPLAVTPDQARRTIRILELARESSSMRRTIELQAPDN